MENIQPNNYTKSKKLKCDWSDKKMYLIQYKLLNIFVRLGVVVEQFREFSSFKQSKWLEKNLSFNTQKRNRAENDFEKEFFILLANAASVNF